MKSRRALEPDIITVLMTSLYISLTVPPEAAVPRGDS